jgi:hypothetical protein
MRVNNHFWGISILIGALSLFTGVFDQTDDSPIRLTKESRGIVRRPPPLEFGRVALAELPAYNPAASQKPFQVDLRGFDLSRLDVQNRAADLWQADFDSLTKWPVRLPQGFDPVHIMDLGKNPGLGVRALHQKGITGRGVGIAIIDLTLLVDHDEYKDRLCLYEEIRSGDGPATMHGVAVSSIAAGKTVGVAPGADLYFIATSFGTGTADKFGRDFHFVAQSMDRILGVQKRLPEGRKIRVISISVGWDRREKGYQEVCDAVERAKKEGIFVVSSSVSQTYGGKLNFHGLGREPLADPDRAGSYGPGSWWQDRFYSLGGRVEETNALLVPMDSRAVASPNGSSEYVFYRNGGWSWSIPYIAGLYALACQVMPGITPEEFWAKALETGDSVMIPAHRSALSQEEIEQIVQKSFLDPLTQLKAQTKPEELEKMIAEGYSRMTGNKIERMSETEFIAWARKTAQNQSGPFLLKTIVNPVRLIEALSK